MISSLFKSGLSTLQSISNISSIQGLQTQKQPIPVQKPTFDIEKIVEQILISLSSVLSQKLGQKIDPAEFKQLSSQVLKTKSLQSTLIETKQKYNDLVNRSTNLYQQARKISNSIGQFITSINLYLQSQELLVPLKQIQKGINDLLPQKVEKQINYLIRIFQNNFQQIVQKKIKLAEANFQEEVKLLKNLNKNFEAEIVSIKNNKNSDQSKYLELNLKITILNQRIAKLNQINADLQKSFKQEHFVVIDKNKIIYDQQKQMARLKLKEGQLLQKIKILEAKQNRLQKVNKQQNNSSQAINQVLQKLKQKQEEIIQELQNEHKKKQTIHQMLRKKIHNQKIILEEKLQSLNQKYTQMQVILQKKQEETEKLQKQNKQLKERNFVEFNIEPEISSNNFSEHQIQLQNQEQNQLEPIVTLKKKISLNDLIKKIDRLQIQKKTLQSQIDKQRSINVNKEVLKTLFLNYDDESKQWSIRRNIKYQIYGLLDLKQMLPKQVEVKESKWFGLF